MDSHLKINLQDIDSTTSNQVIANHSISEVSDAQKLFPEMFEDKIGCVPDFHH